MKKTYANVRTVKLSLLITLLLLVFLAFVSAQRRRTRATSNHSEVHLTSATNSNATVPLINSGAVGRPDQVSGRASIKTDLRRYDEPPLPPLPRAGSKVTDPVFGTEIMRVTDKAGGGSAGTAYSYWSTFNKNNTKLFIQREGVNSGVICDFDPVNFALGASTSVGRPPNDYPVNGEDAIWSGSDPNILYAHTAGGAKIWAYNVVSHTFSLAIDLGRKLNRGENIFQLSKSIDDDVFAFTVKDASYQNVAYMAYRRSTSAVLLRVNVAAQFLDEVQIDKSGRYLVVKANAQGAGVVQVQVKDLVARTSTDLMDDAPDYAPGHSDNGTNSVIGGDNWLNRLTYRSLSAPHEIRSMFSFGNEWNNDFHVSMLGDNEDWALVSFFGPCLTGVFRRELVLIATDGSQRVQRLAHHHSLYTNYLDSPRANLSRDGRFIAFTSNWGGGPRRDLFIARIQPPPRSRQRRVDSAF